MNHRNLVVGALACSGVAAVVVGVILFSNSELDTRPATGARSTVANAAAASHAKASEIAGATAPAPARAPESTGAVQQMPKALALPPRSTEALCPEDLQAAMGNLADLRWATDNKYFNPGAVKLSVLQKEDLRMLLTPMRGLYEDTNKAMTDAAYDLVKDLAAKGQIDGRVNEKPIGMVRHLVISLENKASYDLPLTYASAPELMDQVAAIDGIAKDLNATTRRYFSELPARTK